MFTGKFIDLSEVLEVPTTSEISVKLYQTTWRYKPEDSHLRTRRREDVKSVDEVRFPFYTT
jgi:hypothetical protein